MTAASQRTGTVPSGDVTLFYRVFGDKGKTPILIVHGANYYDSHDWIDVASALASDREVAAFDTRGFGESNWSPSKNYSAGAQLSDMLAVIDHLGWDKVIAMGHSMGGGRVIVFGSRAAARAAAVIIVDHCPGRGGGSGSATAPSVGNAATVFPTIEAAMAAMSRNPDAPVGSPARARLEMFLKPVEGGYVFPRDPDFANPIPVGIDDWKPEMVITDTWQELAAITCPTMIVRGTRSDRYTPEAIARVRDDYPKIEMIDVESGHDVAGAAPGPLIDGVKSFLAANPAL